MNMCSIIRSDHKEPLVVIVSAMGKMTNALEHLLELTMNEKNTDSALKKIRSFHHKIISGLELKHDPELSREVEEVFESLSQSLGSFGASVSYDFFYDQTVSLGEILSTKIIAAYLNSIDIPTFWLDARKVIKTDNIHRQAKVDWGATQALIKSQVVNAPEGHVILSQGFIGSNAKYNSTTLGREGSDFSAAIFATSLDATSVTIWKDVPGVLNADPKKFKKTKLYEQLPYKEAAEMTFYGASVIHPKTIKPLAQKGIPLYVKSFEKPRAKGTSIAESEVPNLAPAIIHKAGQTVISFKISDFSFINESHIHLIFDHIKRLNLSINLMQNSAISFTICMDDNPMKREQLRKALLEDFLIYYNEGLELITIKNYDQATIDELCEGKEIIIEQRSRNNFQMVYK